MNTTRMRKKQGRQKKLTFFLIISLCINIIALIFFSINYSPFSPLSDLSETTIENSPPKYIFLFIGDGLGHSQMMLASQYRATVEQKERGNGNLAMLDFDVTGIAFTDNASTIIGESAASASAMASGIKTYATHLNYDIEDNKAETIAEKLKKQLNYRIGVISSVNINHATPAAFYSHQFSRYDNYGSIFLELLNSDFDFFSGGSLFGITEAETLSGKSFWELLDEKKYSYVRNKNDVLNLENNGDKIIVVPSKLDAYGTLPYAIDYKTNNDPEVLTLAELTKKSIELLDNSDGFFIMVEGGKIDWSAHANDAATLIHEVLAFDEAVSEAVEFYKKNPDDTLIIVVGDHETGGLSLGYSETYTSTYLQYLQYQKISYSAFSQRVSQFRQNNAPFDDVLSDIEYYFGLSLGYDGTSNFYFNGDDMQKLVAAYEMSLIEPSMRYFTMSDYASYGMYDPLTTVVTNLTNKKSGISWGTFSHTFAAVPVFAMGSGKDLFTGSYHLTEIFFKLKNLMNLD